jgi:hypothetical protein
MNCQLVDEALPSDEMRAKGNAVLRDAQKVSKVFEPISDEDIARLEVKMLMAAR